MAADLRRSVLNRLCGDLGPSPDRGRGARARYGGGGRCSRGCFLPTTAGPRVTREDGPAFNVGPAVDRPVRHRRGTLLGTRAGSTNRRGGGGRRRHLGARAASTLRHTISDLVQRSVRRWCGRAAPSRPRPASASAVARLAIASSGQCLLSDRQRCWPPGRRRPLSFVTLWPHSASSSASKSRETPQGNGLVCMCCVGRPGPTSASLWNIDGGEIDEVALRASQRLSLLSQHNLTGQQPSCGQESLQGSAVRSAPHNAIVSGVISGAVVGRPVSCVVPCFPLRATLGHAH